MKRDMERPNRATNTAFLLVAQYDGAAFIPVGSVFSDFFPHLTLDNFTRKATRGGIRLPTICIEPSQEAAKGVHLQELADYIDARRKMAQSGLEAFL
jgi:hypothetical protein